MPIKEKDTYALRDNTRTPFVPGRGYSVEKEVHPRDVDLDAGITGLLPVVGDALQAGQVLIDLKGKKYGKAALGAGLLLLPNIAERPIKQLFKSGAVRVLRREPAMTLDFFNRHFPYQGTNFMYHGVYMDDLAGVLGGETRAMSPSFAINRIGDFNDVSKRPIKYGDATFFGDRSLLDDSILYYGDGNTPVVREALYDLDELVPPDRREEVAERLWQMTKENRVVENRQLIQPSDLRFVDMPKDNKYFEAVIHGTVPLDRMKHVLFSVPENTLNPKKSEKIIQAFSDKGIPVTLYDNLKHKYDKYDDWSEKVLDILNNNQDLLFKTGGSLRKYDKVAALVKRINESSQADFVRRLLDEKRKTLKNAGGTVSTHELGYVTEGDRAVVFPGVQSDGDTLRRYPYPESYERAVQRGDTVQMSVPDAELFTMKYKDYYPGFNQYPGGGRFFRAGETNNTVLGTLLTVPSVAPVVSSGQVIKPLDLGAGPSVIVDQNPPVSSNPAAPLILEGIDPQGYLFDMSGVQPSLDYGEMKLRQRYAESGFKDNLTSKAGAKGRYQIMPITLQEYTNKTGKTGDLMDAAFNEGLRDWYMDEALPRYNAIKRGNPTDLIREYRKYAAYNMGPGALNKALTKAEKDGIDIDTTTDWISYLPKETRDYVNFIVGQEDVSDTSKTKLLYEAAKRLRGVKEDGGLLYDYASGGKIHIKPSHRGRLTELKKRTGKSESELYNDGNPAHKKMVVFARNARKWRHDDGGSLDKFSGYDPAMILEAIQKIKGQK